MPDKAAELMEMPEPNDLNLKRDVKPLDRNVDSLKTEEDADALELGRDLEGTLKLLNEEEKDDLTEKAAGLDCSKTGGQPHRDQSSPLPFVLKLE